MIREDAALELQRVDGRRIARLRRAERYCAAVAGVIAVASTARQGMPGAAGLLAWAGLPMALSFAALSTAASLGLSVGRGAGRATGIQSLLALGAVAFSIRQVLAEAATGARMAELASAAFVLLAVVLLLPLRGKISRYVSGFMLLALGWVVVGLATGEVLGTLPMFSASPRQHVQPATVIVLALLTFVAFAQRAEHGRFSIFLSRGVAGSMARILLPVVLVLPGAREALRSRVVRLTWMPEHYAAGILSSIGTMVALLILILVARKLQKLEMEVQDLSLRDELTGLYNLRGFQILAEQALRVSQRSQASFTVLFVDVDDLKQINDREGHAVGSKLLMEAADFLKAHFRETDIVARIGGDEFAVAGHFTAEAIERAEFWLGTAPESVQAAPRLSLSMGYATTDPNRADTLQDLVERADAAMYEKKRRRKLQAV